MGEHLLSSGVPAFAMAWKTLLLDHEVPDGAVRLYLVLATYARPDRPVAYPNQELLAEQLNCSVDTIQRHGKALVEAGWIDKVRRGRGRSNVYHLKMPGAVRPVIDPVDSPVDEAVDDEGVELQEAADLRFQEAADLRLPYEEEPQEEETPLTPRKAGDEKRAGTRRERERQPLTVEERSSDFEAWWGQYPRPVDKFAAERAWRQMLDRLPDVEQLVESAQALGKRVAREHPETAEWTRWVPKPSTWLRRGGWEDMTTGEPAERPVERRPCVLCGVQDPCPERCMGVALGKLGSTEECVWA